MTLVFIAANVYAQQLAFRGAEGFGAIAIGGRGGKVIFVENLHDNGPGSLRAAIEDTVPRIVIFKISGTIELQSYLVIKSPFITIAGQTAPGDGICLRKYPLIISADDAVVRFLRIRLGDEAGRRVDGLSIKNAKNVIVDHCSISWTLDEGVNTYHGTQNITIQWCLISESLHDSRIRKGHGFAASLGGVNTSYHHNLFANNAGRNPSIAGEEANPTTHLDFRNNVVYNWGHRTLDGRPLSINIVNNYYKAGPASREDLPLVKIQQTGESSFGKWYIQGNVLEMRSGSKILENLVAVEPPCFPPEGAVINFPVEFAPVQTQSAEAAFQSVIRQVGAYLPTRDAVDERILREVQSGQTTYGKGIIQSQAEVGGWPELLSTESPIDRDCDGLPDEWERQFTSENDLSMESSADSDGDGYTNIEEYFDRTNPIMQENMEPDVSKVTPEGTDNRKNYK